MSPGYFIVALGILSFSCLYASGESQSDHTEPGRLPEPDAVSGSPALPTWRYLEYAPDNSYILATADAIWLHNDSVSYGLRLRNGVPVVTAMRQPLSTGVDYYELTPQGQVRRRAHSGTQNIDAEMIWTDVNPATTPLNDIIIAHLRNAIRNPPPRTSPASRAQINPTLASMGLLTWMTSP